MPKKQGNVIITIVAEYDTPPDKDDIVRALDELRAYGTVTDAKMKIVSPGEIDLLKEGY